MNLKISIFILAFLVAFAIDISTADAQEVTVVLKNTKRIEGTVIEDAAGHMRVLSDLGEVKIARSEIGRVLYKSDELKDSLESIEPFKDIVIVHTEDKEAVTGLLIAKGASALIIETDLGRMTIPKNRVKLVEYVSKEYAERGEPVNIRLQSGQDIDGYLYHEDSHSLTMNTRQGRLTVDKTNLRSIKYNVPVAFNIKPGSSSQYFSTPFEDPYSAMPLRRRQDTFDLGFASAFGDKYAAGGGFTYRNRFILKYKQTFSLNVEGSLGITIFGLNRSILSDDQVPGSVAAKGGSIVSSLGVGTPFHFYPVEGSSYEFYFTPLVETHLVYQTLDLLYPSFPALNETIRETKVRFGLGSRIGMEIAIAKRWRAGLSFNMHYLFGENDFNTVSLHVGTRLF